jgi:uncharacterized protein YndB with AHSA1/START domain
VELASDRRFRFEAPPDALWAAIANTDEYRRWWPWLTAFEADGMAPGSVWRCAVRPLLPYTLRFSIHLVDVVQPSLLTATVGGDIAGEARVEVAADGEGSAVRLVSRLAPSSRVFGIVAGIARPIVRRGHDWVIDTGAGQFAERAIGRG